MRRAQDVLDFVRGLGRPIFDPAEIYQSGPDTVRDSAVTRDALRILEEHGHVEPVDGGAVIHGKRRRDVWRLIAES